MKRLLKALLDLVNYLIKHKTMTIKLQLESDAELRAYIKDLIRGQVTSVVRDEINSVITEVMEKQIKKTPEITNAEFLIKSEINKIVREQLKLGSYSANFIQTEARKIIAEKIQQAFANKTAV